MTKLLKKTVGVLYSITLFSLLALASLDAQASDTTETDFEFDTFAAADDTVSSAVAPAPVTMIDLGMRGPLVGIDRLELHGDTIVDSYASNEGPYNPMRAGDLGGLVSGGPVTVTGNAVVCGDIEAGDHSGIVRSGGAVVTGKMGRRSTILDLGLVDCSRAATSNDNHQISPLPYRDRLLNPLNAQGNLRLRTGQTLDLPPGTYYFQDVMIDAGATINVSGPTTLYVAGSFRSTDAELNNTTRMPANLRILSLGDRVEIGGQQVFYGLVYAPSADVDVCGDVDYHGAAIGKTLSITDARGVHFDETLVIPMFSSAGRTVLLDRPASPGHRPQR